jgi:hypothetical protein
MYQMSASIKDTNPTRNPLQKPSTSATIRIKRFTGIDINRTIRNLANW